MLTLSICPQIHNTGCLIHDQVVQLHLTVEEAQPLGLQACTCVQDQEGQDLQCHAITRHSLHSPVVLWPTALLKRKSLGFLSRFPIFPWSWERAGFLSNYAISFLDLPGAMLVPLPNPFPTHSLPQVYLLPCIVAIFAASAHALSRRTISPHHFPINLREGAVVPWGTWKAGLSCPLGY